MNYLISFPRSGQGLSERLLRDVYQHHGWEFSYCLYYRCCKQTPCKKGAEFQKHHDFDLSLELGDQDKHVVLYRRDMITQLEAYFRWIRRDDGVVFDYTNESLLGELVTFIQNHRHYYEGFLDKWVRREDSVAIEYDEYVQEPIDVMVTMLDIFRPSHGLSRSDIQRVMDARGEKVRFKNRLPDETRKQIQDAVAARQAPHRRSALQRWLESWSKQAA